MNEIMSKLRPEECKRRIFMPSEARLEIFLKKYEIRALKFIVLAIKRFFLLKSVKRCIRDSPYLGQRGAWPSWPPGSATG